VSRSICHVVDVVVPELVTWYSYLLGEARKNGNRSLVRTLLRMGRSHNSAEKNRNRFLVRYMLAKDPIGLTMSELRKELRYRASKEAIFRALKDLKKDGLVLSEREKMDSTHIFQRSFVVYHLTEKGRKGIVLPSDRPASERSLSLVDSDMLERDPYGDRKSVV
jgi:DNA-binding MarR family transcriptional regulator